LGMPDAAVFISVRGRFEVLGAHTRFASGYFHPYINVITGG
jgi:hypothetical protein